MEQSIIQELIDTFGPVKWVNKSIFGLKNEGWFLIETIPLPPDDEIKFIISDIINNHEIAYADGKPRHWPECNNLHSIKDKIVKKAINSLKEEKFKIAVCAHSDNYLEGQPIVIGLNPTITYMDFPDHPHINSGGVYKGVYIPDSFCYGYTVEKERYGPSEFDKYIRVFDETTLWLFRHQIWMAIRNEIGKGKWIGKHYKYGLPSEVYPLILNPLSRCRCGSQKKYFECHLPKDISKRVNTVAMARNEKKKDVEQRIIRELVTSYAKRVSTPQTATLSKLNLMIK